MKSHPGLPTHAVVALVLGGLVVSISHAVTIDWVTVGDPGNAAHVSGYGAVSSSFRIMKFEFTNSQYTDFLNTVDPTGTNPYSLYSTTMGSDVRGGITNDGGTDGSRYVVRANMGDKPVNFVSWFDAARVANWLQNGQGSGSTETGAYTLAGATSGDAVARNPGATFYIPNENQWVKAAFYKGGGTNSGYWQYATQVTGTVPVAVTAGLTGIGSAGSTGNFANRNLGADWNSLNGNVTTVGSNGGPGAYGTFDMSGNVFEWIETGDASNTRVQRGGAWSTATTTPLSVTGRGLAGTDSEANNNGFRLASEPLPLIWNTTDGTWDTVSTVWTTGTGGTLAFANGDAVIFNGAGGGTVTLSGTMQPSAITVSAASGTYSFVSSAGNLLGGTTGLAKSGGGTLILSGSNAFTGQTAITGGALLVNGVLSSTTATVSGGLLGGSGTVSGAVQLAAGGTIAPGATPGGTGILTLGSLSGTGGTFAMDITGTGAGQFDQLVTGGNLDYSGNTLQISFTGTYANGSSWDLFGFATQSGTLAGVAPLVATDPAYNGLAWGLAATSANYYDQQYGAGIWLSAWGSNGQRFIFNQADGVLTVVPEPSTFVMAGAGIAGFALLRWRRARRRAGNAADRAA